MAEYSWVTLRFKSVDEELVGQVEDEFGHHDEFFTEDGWTVIGGDRSFGLIEVIEEMLIEAGVEYHRYSDGKYEYDGDEAHWWPGLERPRVFQMLNNGGRVFSENEYLAVKDKSDAELAALIREHFEFGADREEVKA